MVLPNAILVASSKEEILTIEHCFRKWEIENQEPETALIAVRFAFQLVTRNS
jgi:hypothetical protein